MEVPRENHSRVMWLPPEIKFYFTYFTQKQSTEIFRSHSRQTPIVQIALKKLMKISIIKLKLQDTIIYCIL